MNRFPTVRHEGEVKTGKSLNRPKWNELENSILTSALEYHLNTYGRIDYNRVWDEIYQQFPDWQRSLLAVQAHSGDLIQGLRSRQDQKARQEQQMATQEIRRLSEQAVMKAEAEKFQLAAAYENALMEARNAAERERIELQQVVAEKQKRIADQEKELDEMNDGIKELLKSMENLQIDLGRAATDLEREKSVANEALHQKQAVETELYIAKERNEKMKMVFQLVCQLTSDNDALDSISSAKMERLLFSSDQDSLLKDGAELPPVGTSDIPQQDDKKPPALPDIPIDK